MSKRIILLCVVFLMSSLSISCSKPPYDAKSIDSSEVDAPAQETRPATGGGRALKNSEW